MDRSNKAARGAVSCAAVLTALAGAVPCALADDAITGETLDLRTGRGIERLIVLSPDAQDSPAARLNDDRHDKAGFPVLPTAGYTLTSRVVVRADDASALDHIVKATPTLGVRASVESPGFWIITTSSVREAGDLAGQLAGAPGITEAYLDVRTPASDRVVPTDPSFPVQWHLKNTASPGVDANLEPAWDLGYTGVGVVVGVIDGSNVQVNHPDIAGKYVAAASIPGGGIQPHATAVAGVAISTGNNGLGGAGAAYGADLSTIARGSASVNATAFGFRNDLTHIKNNSWGPSDNGKLHTITSIELNALENAVLTGRGGLGEIFVWAAGNGTQGDRVEYDPYAASRYTVAVGAIDDDDDHSWYNELGSAMLVVAPSDGRASNRGIFTTDLIGNPGYVAGDYTDGFGGTSSASPLGAGVIALMLQANPDLNWRDVQHILVHTARKNDATDPGWSINGAGHDIHYAYGYGGIDAGAAVASALAWSSVGADTEVASAVIPVGVTLPDDDPVGETRTVEFTEALVVESVELIITVDTTYVGDVVITMTSPMGTQSIVAAERFDDTSGIIVHKYTSMRHWDETLAGTWTVHLADEAAQDSTTWTALQIIAHGTAPAVCPGDLTGSIDPNSPAFGVPDGLLDANDFFYYLDRFGAGDLSIADLTGSVDPNNPAFGVPDGVLDATDFFFYLSLFAAGCP